MRTPLNSIINMIELSLDDSPSDESLEWLTIAKNNALILLSNDNDTLDVFQINH